MSKPQAAQSSADESYWSLVDARARLMSERAALCHADGRSRGFAVLSWESPMRRRASALAAEINLTNQRFERERARFAMSMRNQTGALAMAIRDARTPQVDAVAARSGGEFVSLRAQVRASAAADFDDAGALRALEQKLQSTAEVKR